VVDGDGEGEEGGEGGDHGETGAEDGDEGDKARGDGLSGVGVAQWRFILETKLEKCMGYRVWRGE
jgi:hypothetical protein